jgi:protein PhnA
LVLLLIAGVAYANILVVKTLIFKFKAAVTIPGHTFKKTAMPNSAIPACPQCGLENTYPDGGNYVCPDCTHEWPMQTSGDEENEDGAQGTTDGIVRDSNGNPLADGDAVILIKDLKVKGSSIVLKKGTKVKSIRLPQDAGDHEVDCKTDQGGFMLKACFLKKA